MGGQRAPGFTLIELLVTVAILAIVSMLATTGYSQYMRRVNRVDATSALLRVASAQEKYYAQNGEYADAPDLAVAPPAGLGIAGTEKGYYSLDIDIAAAGTSVGYTASATVDDASAQASDEDCWVLTIDERGQRGAETRSGATSPEITARCWR